MTYDIIIVGLGKSARDEADTLKKFCTIGVNDVGDFLSPTYLLVLDKLGRFTQERVDTIEGTPANRAYVCHQDDWLLPHVRYGVTKLETKKFTHLQPEQWDLDKGPIPHFMTSPFAAIGLAYRFRSKNIGIIGMDLLRDHHMSKAAGKINKQLKVYRDLLAAKGVGLFNCSPIANLPALPFKPLMAMRPSKARPA